MAASALGGLAPVYYRAGLQPATAPADSVTEPCTPGRAVAGRARHRQGCGAAPTAHRRYLDNNLMHCGVLLWLRVFLAIE